MDANTKDFYWEVGNRIRLLTQEKKYTVETLSEMAGISTKYMYQIETGKVRFSTEILYKIANALEVTSDTLLGGKDTDIGRTVLLEVTGKFTSEEKEYIKRLILQDILDS